MEPATLPNRVKDVIAEVAGVHGETTRTLVKESTTLLELGYDSLDRVELANAIEEAFGILPTDKEAQQWVTVADVVQYVKTLAK